MSEQNKQFNAVTPERGNKGKKNGNENSGVTTQQEVLEASSKQYFEERENSCVYLGVEVPKGSGGELVPSKEAFTDYFYTEEDYLLMREFATSMKLKQPLLVEGGTGIGKTSAVKKMAADLNMNYGLVSFHENSDIVDVIGHKDIHINDDGKEEIVWIDGRGVEIIRDGGILFVDEYNFQGSKVGGRFAPIIDAILNGDKKIYLTENDNEPIDVHDELVLVMAQNPPGQEDGDEFTGRDMLSAEKFGRLNFHKLSGKMSTKMEQKRMQGMIGMDVEVNIPSEEFRYAGEGIPLTELKDIPGMTHWVEKYVELREIIEAKVRDRSIGRQAQKIYFNPRLGQKILRYVAEFYRGDINEVWKNALEYYIEKMFKSKDDRDKVKLLIEQSKYNPPKEETKRKGLDRGKKDKGDENTTDDKSEPETVKTPEELEKEKAIKEIKRIREKIKESGKAPEEWFVEQIITATTPEGKEITFNMEQILNESKEFYQSINMTEWVNELPDTIELTEDQIQNIKEKVEKFGFNRMKAFPSVETQNKTLEKLKQETHTSIDELDEEEQYSDKGFWLSSTVKPEFPDKIRNINRPEGVYIQLYNDDQEVPNETLDKTYPQAREYQKENNLQGYTLAEYAIFQREFTKENKKHPEHKKWTWLTDSEISDSASPQVFDSGWDSDDQQVNVDSLNSDDRDGDLGFRSSAVLSI